MRLEQIAHALSSIGPRLIMPRLIMPRLIASRLSVPRTMVSRLIAFSLIAVLMTGCGGGSAVPPPPPPGTKLSVSPASITVDAGSATTFMGVFTPAAPADGSLTWSIAPVDGGTITGGGVLTSSATAGSYTVLATWTPSLSLSSQASSKATILMGSARVKVLAVPRFDSVISPGQVQATGANQAAGAIQNGAVAGPAVPSVLATDSFGNTQVLSGFTIPTSECNGFIEVCK